MAIATPTTVLASSNTANLTVYDTAVATLTANRLYIILVNGYRSAGGTNISTIQHDPLGTPLSFTLINDGTDNASRTPWDAAVHRALHAYYVIPGSTTASALIRITWASGQSACGWRLIEIASGFDATGGSTTFPGVATADSGGTAGTAIAVTMASFAATDNMTLLCMGWGSGTANPTQTVATTESRTELGEHNDGERGSQGVHYQNPHGSDTSIGATLSANNEWAAIGIEVAAASTTTPVTGTDSATESEANAVLTTAVTRTDSATLSEAIQQVVAWNTTDTTTVSEAGTASAALTQSDSATASEALTSLTADAVVTDSATTTDALVWAVAWSPTDGVTLTDTPATHADVTAADSLTLTEVGLAEQGAITITDTDTVTVSEALTALEAATVAVDTTTVTDALTWNVDWAVADSATVTDTQSVFSTGGSFITASDTATVSEALTSLTAAWQLADTPTLSDYALIDATGTKNDAVGITDAVTGLHFDVVASDSLTVTEAIATIPLELIAAEAAALSEGLGWTVDWSAVDVVTVTDTESAVLVLPDVFRGRPRGSVEVNPRCAGTGKVGRVGVTP